MVSLIFGIFIVWNKFSIDVTKSLRIFVLLNCEKNFNCGETRSTHIYGDVEFSTNKIVYFIDCFYLISLFECFFSFIREVKISQQQ